MKIWYFTRSFYPFIKTGGALIRTSQVKNFKKFGWNIETVTPNYNSKKLVIENGVYHVPFSAIYNQKIANIFERLGIYEDYLDGWVKQAFEILKDKIDSSDILFATSGGELGMIKLGSLLKQRYNCKLIVNFHDPIAYSKVCGLKIDNRFHISREKSEKKYLEQTDMIITSSLTNRRSLQKKYPNLKEVIHNNYFGYIAKTTISKRKIVGDTICIAYVGAMSKYQSPEILYEVYKNLKYKARIQIYFIGNYSAYRPLMNINDPNIIFIDYLDHEHFMNFMLENIDIGFVSLSNDYFGACVPSKIYEYINLEIPILGALPDGDAKDIIVKNKFGLAFDYKNIKDMAYAIDEYINIEYIEDIRKNIKIKKDEWFMDNQFKIMNSLLRNLNDMDK
ncbi:MULTISPECIES: glycosyltransferase [Campylobacter]|uniref:glycosyltransferase n=1 Tax=Campylobacter TaxID=194 RepID=UPI00027A397D|nr:MULTISPECIES: glycosyltransferase [Campylobacter]EJP74536.1 glycosyltransferase, group 1 family protein [Campylobacter sp. FOBRC14]QKF61463.1 glycosyltransferase, family 1 [Campylobacter curvus]UEB49772.1 hypothetical protein LK426_09160 [Campylobacter curvus]